MKRFVVLAVIFVFSMVASSGRAMGGNLPADSSRQYFKFQLKKPYIGFEFKAPSSMFMFAYQQEFFTIAKRSFMDLQIELNNKNLLLHNQMWIYAEEKTLNNNDAYKTSLFLLQRNDLFKWLSISVGIGFQYYQDWYFYNIYENNHYNFYSGNSQNNFLIFKSIISLKPTKNIMFNVNANFYDFFKALDPYIGSTFNNISYSLLFGFNGKRTGINTFTFNKRQLFFNFMKQQVGYEHFIYLNNTSALSGSIASTIIPFKRYSYYSDKFGIYTLTDGMINFNYSLSDMAYSFVGAGMFYNYISYYVLSSRFDISTYGVRTNLGIAVSLTPLITLKIAYTPYYWKNINLNVENMDWFKFHRYYKLNLHLAYSFGKYN